MLECNPLPGLTPGYSDLCLIAQAAGIEYRTLIGEILEGGLKRLREKRREAKSEARGWSGTLLIARGRPPITSARRFRRSGRTNRSQRSTGFALTSGASLRPARAPPQDCCRA